MPGLRCCEQAFSSCRERGLLFVSVSGLLLAVSSLVAEHRLWGTWASVVVVHGLVAPRHVGSSQTRDLTCVPCIGRQILSIWATREVLEFSLMSGGQAEPIWPGEIYIREVPSALLFGVHIQIYLNPSQVAYA